jgi:hypothetical protein
VPAVTKATTRCLPVLALLAASCLLATGCGGGPAHNGVTSLASSKSTTTQSSATGGSSSSSSSEATEAQLLTYAECMRAHGIPDFPDPVPSPLGGYAFHAHISPGSDLDPNSPRNQSAQKACQEDVPPSIANATPARMAVNALKWSKCMQTHGEPNFPEPNGQGVIKITNATGTMDPNSPQFQRAEKACQSLGNSPFVLQWPSGSIGP